MSDRAAFPLTAEQIVALLAEAVNIVLEEGFDRKPMAASHMGSPHWRLARAIGIEPAYLRNLAADEIAPSASPDAEPTR